MKCLKCGNSVQGFFPKPGEIVTVNLCYCAGDDDEFDYENETECQVDASFDEALQAAPVSKKCECGAESAGTGGHSPWCPAATEEDKKRV